MKNSQTLYDQAVKVLPAGVNSPVRAFRSVGGTPIFMEKGEGTYLFDADGNRYLDFCGSWGPLVLGHRHPEVQAAITEVVGRGWTFGTPVKEEVALAQLVADKLDAVEMMRFVNSGTEAVMSAIRLARGTTGRDKILKFRGCYHGHVDYLLVDAGSGLATFGTAASAGVPDAFAELTALAPLDDLEGLQKLFAEIGEQIAAVVIEGVPANNGLLIQSHEYIAGLRRLCDQYGALLIFDEVLAGFRMPEVMAYAHYGVQPDLVCLGKVIGGGMPVGAYGGRAEIMHHIAPLGKVYQAGTLSGNPVAMAAGYATLKAYYEADVPAVIEKLGAYLDPRMEALLADVADLGFIRLGSLFWFYFKRAQAPRTAEAIAAESGEIYGKLHRLMLDRGIYMAPSSYEVGFLNAAMTTTELDMLLDGIKAAVEEGIVS
ncbi:glutamate-1-semialdehyde 2,1-aminomutase [Acanthopleuribacter pedis]|uniref:Glutamate-1-semialdehyde 2,1-aminomutase n=1 Tax=Acanthopleuribacter pedis TaxID=442870 RepID=A0A8J7Q5M0_9BACT|nr:glutamate-1-semialdehyde 2,1-aminomutase [Acanthopleuribacter pedis]MBO1317059.1 glutamate-1-semialdehyde 2,1-aminomutase [Acanthopleuribacter pedis]